MPDSKKLGRPEETSLEELNRICSALRMFFEDEWGRIGLHLQRARKPDDILAALRLVPGVKWCPAFRDFDTRCLLNPGSNPIEAKQLDDLRKQHKLAVDVRRRLLSEQQRTWPEVEKVTNAFSNALISFGAGLHLRYFFFVVFAVAKHLRVHELRGEWNDLAAAYQKAIDDEKFVAELLSASEGWFARNEVVAFVRNRRYRKDRPIDFAVALAGLPKYSWLYSIRKYKKLPAVSIRPTFKYQLFEMLQTIIKKIKRLDWLEIEKKLAAKLLSSDTDPQLQESIEPNWWYMKSAIAECKGKKLKRTDVPYRIMANYLNNMENATQLERELAERNQLSS